MSLVISGPVRVHTTPDSASASETSMLVIFAWANGERTNARCSMPSSLISSTNFPLPRTRRASSLRLIDWPTQSPVRLWVAVAMISFAAAVTGDSLSVSTCRAEGGRFHRRRSLTLWDISRV